MQLGFVGLGKMGLNMVARLSQHGFDIIGHARHSESIKAAEAKGATGAYSLVELVDKLETPRIIWLMVPAGDVTENIIKQLIPLLDPEDIIIDGGNSFYKDSIRHAQELATHEIHFLDIGTSGGIWGLKIGYCMMIGGDKNIFKHVEPALKVLAPKDGYAHVGTHGAGHFVKMVHNGIEYAMLQAYGEGFELLHAKKDFDLDLQQISHLWNQGSVIRSWLLELAEDAFTKDPELSDIAGFVADSGEGRWTAQEGIDLAVPLPTISLALLERFRSRQPESFSAKTIAALRNEFGGHAIKSTKKS